MNLIISSLYETQRRERNDPSVSTKGIGGPSHTPKTRRTKSLPPLTKNEMNSRASLPSSTNTTPLFSSSPKLLLHLPSFTEPSFFLNKSRSFLHPFPSRLSLFLPSCPTGVLDLGSDPSMIPLPPRRHTHFDPLTSTVFWSFSSQQVRVVTLTITVNSPRVQRRSSRTSSTDHYERKVVVNRGTG